MVRTYKATHSLPASMTREIGRFIVRYAYLEQYLQSVIYMLVGVSAGIGRLAVREPGKLTDKLALVRDIIAAKALNEPPLAFKDIRESIEDAMDMRNLCAHSTWTWSPEHKGWAVLVSRGTWKGVPEKERARRNKRLFAERQIVRQETLRDYLTGLAAIEGSFRLLQANLEAQLKASPEIRQTP